MAAPPSVASPVTLTRSALAGENSTMYLDADANARLPCTVSKPIELPGASAAPALIAVLPTVPLPPSVPPEFTVRFDDAIDPSTESVPPPRVLAPVYVLVPVRTVVPLKLSVPAPLITPEKFPVPDNDKAPPPVATVPLPERLLTTVAKPLRSSVAPVPTFVAAAWEVNELTSPGLPACKMPRTTSNVPPAATVTAACASTTVPLSAEEPNRMVEPVPTTSEAPLSVSVWPGAAPNVPDTPLPMLMLLVRALVESTPNAPSPVKAMTPAPSAPPVPMRSMPAATVVPPV